MVTCGLRSPKPFLAYCEGSTCCQHIWVCDVTTLLPKPICSLVVSCHNGMRRYWLPKTACTNTKRLRSDNQTWQWGMKSTGVHTRPVIWDMRLRTPMAGVPRIQCTCCFKCTGRAAHVVGISFIPQRWNSLAVRLKSQWVQLLKRRFAKKLILCEWRLTVFL